jgi:hypothetical protein
MTQLSNKRKLTATNINNRPPLRSIRPTGLEADVVIVVVTDGLLSDTHASELLYTGISRAKAALFVVGSDAVRLGMLEVVRYVTTGRPK